MRSAEEEDHAERDGGPRLISDQETIEIVRSVRLPNICNLDAARDLINDAGCFYAANRSLKLNYRHKIVLNDLEKLHLSLRKTIEYLKPRHVMNAIYESLTSVPSVDQIVELSDLIETKIADRQRAILDTTDSIIFKHSPFEWLVGRYLYNAFSEIFGKEATYTYPRDGGEPQGYFIEFCLYCMKYLCIDKSGTPFRPSSIAEALKKVRGSKGEKAS